MKLVKDILKGESGKEIKYSQGRIYLLIAFIAYIAMLGFLAFKMINCNFIVDVTAPQTIIDALQWIIALLAGYVFGGKGLEVLKVILKNKADKKEKKDKPNDDGPTI